MIRTGNYAFAVLLGLTSIFTLVSCSSEVELPNIVIILVDDMGYGDPGCYNPDSRIPTPNIDGLAEEGMRFSDAHAAGTLCHPSRYGLLTGTYPFRTNTGVWRKKPLIGEDQITIASMLKSRGYHTAMVGKWHLGFLEEGYTNPLRGGPVDRGFDSFFGIRASTDIPPYFYIRNDRAVTPPTDSIPASSTEGWSPIQGEFWRAGGIAPGLELRDVLPKFTEEAIEVITRHSKDPHLSSKPLLLYLAYPAPHTPWLPDLEFEGKSGAGMYGDFMMMVDAQIGKVLDALSEVGLSENTLLVFTSDNGPVWYDEDMEKWGHDSSGGLKGMKADAWEGGHRMPFIVRWPGMVSAGTRSRQVICFTDLLATLGEATATHIPEHAAPDAYSILPVLTGNQPEEDPIRPPVVLSSGNGTMFIRSGKWKLVRGLGSGGFSMPSKIESGPGDPLGQLYNMEDDPFETNNLYAQYPDIVKKLESQMRSIVDGKKE